MTISDDRPRRFRQSLFCVGTLCTVLATGTLLACQVPVFRYALERWDADVYHVALLSKGAPDAKLSHAARQAFRDLTDRRRVRFHVVDVDSSDEPRYRTAWQDHGGRDASLVAVYYPSEAATPDGRAAFVTRATRSSLSGVATSPTRRELARRLADGDSAVWILLEGDDPKENAAAEERLSRQLRQDATWLKVPSPLEMEIDESVVRRAKVDLRIDFSILRLDRDDPRESFLVDALVNSEDDLREFDEPIAFPVFGRGRVLYALVGDGITGDTIRAASAFIAGPCSCQVKGQNPGFDLLMDHDWQEAVGDTLISEPIPSISAEAKLIAIPPGRDSTP